MPTGRRLSLVALLLIPALHAQSSDWTALQKIKPDQNVDVALRDGSLLRGAFRTWTPAAIEIEVPARGLASFKEGDVSRVRLRHPGSRAKAALWGALIGFAIGFPIGAASAGYLADRNSPPITTRLGMGAGIGMFSAGIGAGLGALTGGARRETIYRMR